MNLRTLFYSQMAIDAKSEETIKLNEYIAMEKEKLIEARLKFDEDSDKFHKYVKEVDRTTQETHILAEATLKERIELNDVIEGLNV